MEEFERVSVLRERGFRQLFEHCPVGVIIYTLDRHIALANPAFHNLLGYSAGELEAKHWTELTHPDDVVPQESQMEGMLSGENFTLRKRYLSRNGQTVWADVFGSLLRDDEGQPSHYIGIIVDCGKRVAAENSLRESEALFRSLVENIPDGISRFDREHRLLFVDQISAQNFGLEGSSILGCRLEDIEGPPETIASCIDAIDRVFASGLPALLELEHEGRHYSWRLLRENPESGQEMVLGVLHDITASRRRKRERRLRLLRAERLSEAGVVLAEAGLDMERVLDVLVRLASSIVGDGCIISILSEDGSRLDGAAVHHIDEEVLELGQRLLAAAPFRPDDPIFSNLLLTGKPLRLNHLPPGFLHQILRPEHRELAGDFPIRHMLSAPMRAHQKVLGLISVITSREKHAYTAEDESLLQELADRAGLTLASAQLYQENLRQAEELRQNNEELERRVLDRTRQLKEANLKLYAMATHDPLTGLSNRRQFNTTLDKEIRRCRRAERWMAVLMLDIDQFKRYNDHYGHQQGDKCLQQVAAVLSECCRRGSDMVARYGGEEFVAVLTELEPHQAQNRAEEIRRAVESCQIPHAASEVSSWVTVSVGLACDCPDAKHTPEWWVASADEALYISKKRGRNRVTMWQPSSPEPTESEDRQNGSPTL